MALKEDTDGAGRREKSKEKTVGRSGDARGKKKQKMERERGQIRPDPS